MAYKVVVSKQAQESLWEAMDWYENQSFGLGAKLMKEFYDNLYQLADNPLRFMVVFEPFRRMLLKRFPYKVIFVVDEKKQNVVIVMLWHVKRTPDSLEMLLRK